MRLDKIAAAGSPKSKMIYHETPVGIYSREYFYTADGKDRILVFEGVE